MRQLVNRGDIEELILDIAIGLRSRGYNIGTSEIVESIKIIDSYMAQTRSDNLDINTLAFILSSTFSQEIPENDLVEEIQRNLVKGKKREYISNLYNEILERINRLNVKPGQHIRKKQILNERKKHRLDRMKAYFELQKLNIIKGPPGKERVASKSEIYRIINHLVNQGYSSINDALTRNHGKFSLDDALTQSDARIPLSRSDLEKLDNNDLFKLAIAAKRKHYKELYFKVAEEISRRLLSGERIDANQTLDLLSNTGILTSDHEKKLVALDPSLASSRKIKMESLIQALNDVDPDKAARILSKALKELDQDKVEHLLSNIDPYLLWDTKKVKLNDDDKTNLVKAAINAGRSLREALLYAETRDTGRADASIYYADIALSYLEKTNKRIGNLDKHSIIHMINSAKTIIKLADGDPSSALQLQFIVNVLGFERSLNLLKNLYNIYKDKDKYVKELIEWNVERLIYRVASKEGLRLLPKYKFYTSKPGRIDLRRSIYNNIRRRDSMFIFKRKLKSNYVSLALDISGSMAYYSAWALGISSLFIRSLDKITLFSHNTVEVKGPFSLRDISRILLLAEFKGYTDIYTGLLKAGQTKARRIVIVTDLYQTVNSGDPYEAFKSLTKNKKVLVILPRQHNRELRKELENLKVKIVVSDKPKDAARETLRWFLR